MNASVAAPSFYDVVIVGAGPTGSVAAILLAQQGHSVLLLERQLEPYPLPRAVAFDAEVGRLLQRCGIGPELRSLVEPADTYEWRNGAGQVLLRFDLAGVGPTGWPTTSMFHQPDLERLLGDRIAALPGVDVRRGRELVSFDIDPDGDAAAIHHRGLHTADDAEVVRARFLVGCDGANSTVRQLLDIGFDDLGFFFDWLVVDVQPHEPRVYDPINLQVCDPARPTTLVSGGPGRRRWEFMRRPDDDPEQLSGEASAWRLLEPWDVGPHNAHLERHANYTFRARWVAEWRRGTVFLAGDAAHQMPPFAGQGMCAGVRDAANLAWKLSLVLHGHSRGAAAERVLDSYAVERAPHVRAVIDSSIELGKVICIPDPAEAAARDEFMLAMAASGEPPPVPASPDTLTGVVDSSPGAGVLAVQGRVLHHGEEGDLDDVIGGAWQLVTAGVAAPSAELAAWFVGLDGRIVAIGREVDDIDGAMSAWLRRLDASAVLVRPDGRVFGTAATVDDVGPLVGRLRAQLTDQN